jgi:hypothetical protein
MQVGAAGRAARERTRRDERRSGARRRTAHGRNGTHAARAAVHQ